MNPRAYYEIRSRRFLIVTAVLCFCRPCKDPSDAPTGNVCRDKLCKAAEGSPNFHHSSEWYDISGKTRHRTKFILFVGKKFSFNMNKLDENIGLLYIKIHENLRSLEWKGYWRGLKLGTVGEQGFPECESNGLAVATLSAIVLFLIWYAHLFTHRGWVRALDSKSTAPQFMS